MFRKSDLLTIGHHHQTRDGMLHVSLDSEWGSCDLIVLREVLALFDAQVVTEGQGMDNMERPVPNQIGYRTNLPFGELESLDFADSFPVLASNRVQAVQDAKDAKQRQRDIEASDNARRAELQKQRDDEVRAKLAMMGR